MKFKSIFCATILFVTLLITISAEAQQKYIAALSGLQAIPANSSNGNGKCVLELNAAQTQVAVNCSYSSLTGSAVGGNLGFGAPIGGTGAFTVGTVNSGGGGQSGTINFTASVNPQRVAELRSNQTYFTVNTTSFPNGEIRGQIHLANGTYNDFDGDGRTDLTVYRTSNRTFYNQSSLTGNLFERQIGQVNDSVSLTVDFDGDGKSDHSTAAYLGNFVWRIFQSTTNTLKEIPFGGNAFNDFFAAGDYDGDGKFDIAVFRAGVWYIIESSTGNYRYEYFGQSGDVPAANDYDKDGKADLTVARSENGVRVWYVRRSSDNQAYRVEWGLSSDAFFTGRSDFDGDGAADISVIRNESGQRVFYIRRSSDSQLQIIRWGAPNDVVKLGDYDGDGKTDAAVTRAVSGNRVFFILQSSNNQPRYEYFGLAGDF